MATPTPLSNPAGDRHQSVWASKTFIGSAVVVLLLILGGVALVVDRPGSTPAAPSAGPTAAAPGADTTIPATAPVASWTDFHGVAIPSSPTAGPSSVTGDVARGFAHNPTGALFAAAQLPIRRILAADWTAVIDASIDPGPGVAAWRQARAQLGTTITPPTGGWTQTAGYRFLAYNPTEAVVQLLNAAPSGSYTVTVETVRWSGGDWKLVLQDNGDDTPNVTAADSPAGFTIWRGDR